MKRWLFPLLLFLVGHSFAQVGGGLPAMGSTWSGGSGGIAAPVWVNTLLSVGAGAPQGFTISPTAGHGIIIGGYFCGDSGSCTAAVTGSIVIKDNINNPETCFVASPASPISVNDSGGFLETWNWWICPSIPAGVTSFTLTQTSNFFEAFWLTDASGVPASPVDSEGHAQSATTTVTGSVTTGSNTNTTDLCFAMVDNDADRPQLFTLTSVANASAGSTVYTGTITGGGSNSLAGITFNVTGFATGANNGRFAATASSTTTLTLSNASGAAETHTGKADTFGSGWTGRVGDISANGWMQTITTSGTGTQTGQASWSALDTWLAEAICIR